MNLRDLTCEQADELDKTRRVMGSGSLTRDEHRGLRRHAVYCPREDWHHALNPSMWHLIEADRHRVRNPMGRLV